MKNKSIREVNIRLNQNGTERVGMKVNRWFRLNKNDIYRDFGKVKIDGGHGCG